MHAVTVPELARLLDAEPDTQLLDVREPSEYAEAELPGAVELPYREVRARAAGRARPRRGRSTRSARAARGRRSPRACSRGSGFDARPTLGGGVRDVVAERARLVESR